MFSLLLLPPSLTLFPHPYPLPNVFHPPNARAAKLANIKVMQLINTPTAVGLNYGVFRRSSFNETAQHILFYDMGATSTAATIIGFSTVKEKGSSTPAPQLEVKGLGFDRMLGGIDFDYRLRAHLLKAFQAGAGKNLEGNVATNPRALAKLSKEATRVKKILSANTETISQVEGLYKDTDFRVDVTRAEFEEMCSDLLARVSTPITTALDNAGLKLENIDQIILVGGGPRFVYSERGGGGGALPLRVY